MFVARFAGVESEKLDKLKVQAVKHNNNMLNGSPKCRNWLSKIKKMISLCLCASVVNDCPKCPE
jgi:hypothetical protein